MKKNESIKNTDISAKFINKKRNQTQTNSNTWRAQPSWVKRRNKKLYNLKRSLSKVQSILKIMKANKSKEKAQLNIFSSTAFLKLNDVLNNFQKPLKGTSFCSTNFRSKKHFFEKKTVNLISNKSLVKRNLNTEALKTTNNTFFYSKLLFNKKKLVKSFATKMYAIKSLKHMQISAKSALQIYLTTATDKNMFVLNVQNLDNSESLVLTTKKMLNNIEVKIHDQKGFLLHGYYIINTEVFSSLLITFNNMQPTTLKKLYLEKQNLTIMLNIRESKWQSTKVLQDFFKTFPLSPFRNTLAKSEVSNQLLVFKLLLTSNEFKKFLFLTLTSGTQTNKLNSFAWSTDKKKDLLLGLSKVFNNNPSNNALDSMITSTSAKKFKLSKQVKRLTKLVYKLSNYLKTIELEKDRLKISQKLRNYTLKLKNELKKTFKQMKHSRFLNKSFIKTTIKSEKVKNNKQYLLNATNKYCHKQYNSYVKNMLLLPYNLRATRNIKIALRQLYKITNTNNFQPFNWKIKFWQKIKLAYKLYFYSKTRDKAKKKKLFSTSKVFNKFKWNTKAVKNSKSMYLLRNITKINRELSNKRSKLISNFFMFKKNWKPSAKLKALGKGKKRSFKKRKYNNFNYNEYGKWKSLRGRFWRRLKLKQYFFKFYGNLQWRQFHKFFDNIRQRRGHRTQNWLFFLERRIHTLLLRTKIAATPGTARQLIQHGHILIQNKKIRYKNYLINPDDLLFYVTDKIGEKIYSQPYKYNFNYRKQLKEIPEHVSVLNMQVPLFARCALSSNEELFSWLTNSLKQEIHQKLQNFWSNKGLYLGQIAKQTRVWNYDMHTAIEFKKKYLPALKQNWKIRHFRGRKRRKIRIKRVRRFIRKWQNFISKKNIKLAQLNKNFNGIRTNEMFRLKFKKKWIINKNFMNLTSVNNFVPTTIAKISTNTREEITYPLIKDKFLDRSTKKSYLFKIIRNKKLKKYNKSQKITLFVKANTYKKTNYKKINYKKTNYKKTNYKKTNYKKTNYKKTNYKKTFKGKTRSNFFFSTFQIKRVKGKSNKLRFTSKLTKFPAIIKTTSGNISRFVLLSKKPMLTLNSWLSLRKCGLNSYKKVYKLRKVLFGTKENNYSLIQQLSSKEQRKRQNIKNLKKLSWNFLNKKKFRLSTTKQRFQNEVKLRRWMKERYKKNSFYWEREFNFNQSTRFFKIFKKKIKRKKFWKNFYKGWAFKQVCFYFNAKRLNKLRQNVKTTIFFWRKKQLFKQQLFQSTALRLFIGFLNPVVTGRVMSAYSENSLTAFRGLEEIKWHG